MECSTLSAGRSSRATPSHRRRSPTSSPWPRDRRLGPATIEPLRLKRVVLERHILLRVIHGSSAIRPVALLTRGPGPSKNRSLTRAALFRRRARQQATHHATDRLLTRGAEE